MSNIFLSVEPVFPNIYKNNSWDEFPIQQIRRR